MRIRISLSSAVAAAVVTLVAVRGGAQGISFAGSPVRTELTPPEKAFVQSYVAAVTGTDIDLYKRLLHPGTRACMNAANAKYFDWVLKRRVGRQVRNPLYTVQTVPAKFGMFSALESQGYQYPVKPTQAFHMNLVTTGDEQSSISAFAALDNGKWYEVLPCPAAKKSE